jgi:CheY-like chemotaxis protein
MPLILVVDDDEPVREYARLALEAAGYEVATAWSGENALKYLVLGRPDLLLIDVNMPGMSGLELIARIRLRQRFKDTPVLVFSASGLGVDIQAAIRAGAGGYLLKPFSAEDLTAKVASVLAAANPGHWADRAEG